jgi:hypothetical protein
MAATYRASALLFGRAERSIPNARQGRASWREGLTAKARAAVDAMELLLAIDLAPVLKVIALVRCVSAANVLNGDEEAALHRSAR